MAHHFTQAVERSHDVRELHNLLALAFKLLTRDEYNQIEWQAFRRAEEL